MISVQEAEKIVLDKVTFFTAEECELEEAYGRVLREDVVADRDYPPYHRATMDGVAICYADWEKGCRKFLREGIQKPGEATEGLQHRNSCLEIMTGASLPAGCDCVVPYEHVDIQNSTAQLKPDVKIFYMQNLHQKAQDYQKGEQLLRSGDRLNSANVGIAAAVGHSRVKVSIIPKIAVIGTGDELVDIRREKIEPYHIRHSNVYAVQALLMLNGFSQTYRFHIRDDKQELSDSLTEIIKEHHVVILSGGVSMGKFDFVPEILQSLGVEVLFHKVKQKPGKPFWFGKEKSGKPIFALPGNPISTQVCAGRYVLPYLRKASGLTMDLQKFFPLAKYITVDNAFTNFLPASLACDPAHYEQIVLPVNFEISGNYASLANTDGFIELPAETYQFKRGQAVRFFSW